MAETYHVYNWRELPLKTAAVLASGLHEDCRSFRKLSGRKITTDQSLRLMMLDELRLLRWLHTEDARKGKNRPESVLQKIMEPEKPTKLTGFQTPEEFEARKKKIIEGS